MQKIKSITLRNFKYFYGVETEQPQNKIELDSNNLLLYGENGSGKSSLYWAIYTFLQSAIKEPTSEIEKYFEPTNPQNLRNRFAHEDAESGIMIQFEAPTGGTLKEIKRNTNKTYSINTFQDTFITRALVGSDFINYKFLSKIYDFRNSEVINLFEMFDREIFMFVDFEEAFTFHDGTLSTKTYASDWWKFISEAYRTLPYNGNIVSVGSVEYKRFKNVTIPRFIELLKKFLLEITQGTNEYLENEFKEKISISFDIDNVKCDFNKNISQRAKDGKLHKPKIPLIVKLNHDKLGENKSSLHKPHTFLNEASLTAIALAIRLSILDRRPTFPDSARILILDDLLLSLDMSHRDKVLDIFLSEAFINTYQILILTHDRSFYNMCKNRIQDRFDKGWLFKEMYQHQTDAGVPCPFMPKKESHLDMAIKYLKEFDYPASANYLRKEAERVLCYLLPKHLTFFDKLDEGSSILNLEGLISRFEVYYKALGGNYAPFKKLKEHKDLLLNPLSHDNIESPIYKRELDSTIDILKNLNKLKVHTFGLPDENDAMKFELHETDIDSDNWVFEFTLKETLRAIKSLNGQWLLSNPSVNFLSRENKTKNLPKEALKSQVKLSQGYGNIRFRLGTKKDATADTLATDNIKDLKEIILKDTQKLSEILTAKG